MTHVMVLILNRKSDLYGMGTAPAPFIFSDEYFTQ